MTPLSCSAPNSDFVISKGTLNQVKHASRPPLYHRLRLVMCSCAPVLDVSEQLGRVGTHQLALTLGAHQLAWMAKGGGVSGCADTSEVAPGLLGSRPKLCSGAQRAAVRGREGASSRRWPALPRQAGAFDHAGAPSRMKWKVGMART